MSNCLSCGTSSPELLFTGRDYRCRTTEETFNVVKCPSCGLVFLDPLPDENKLAGYYPPAYYQLPQAGLRKFIVEFLGSRKIAAVRKYKQSGRLLDVGCGNGDFLLQISRQGFEVYGLDVSPESCRLTRSRLNLDGDTVRILNQSVMECNLAEHYFEVITLWHVFEHLSNPGKALDKLHRLIKTDGVLVIEIPNFNSVNRLIFGKYYFHMEIPRHIFHYSRRTIKDLLERSGFEVIRTSQLRLSFPLSSFHSFQMWLKNKTINKPLLFSLTILAMPLFLAVSAVNYLLPFWGDDLLIYARPKSKL